MAERRSDRSPFPGMDPYLERYWSSVHFAFINRLADALNAVLPDDLVASPGERLAVGEDDDELAPDWSRYPDVSVIDRGPSGGGGQGAAVADLLEAEAPVVARVLGDPERQAYLHVLGVNSDEIVTAIELVSPTNESAAGHAEFARKRDEMLDAGVNWVEIDLVRAGDWRRLMGTVAVAGPRCVAQTVYRVAIRAAGRANRVYLYPIGLRDRLPTFPLPLRPDDPRVEVDLQAILDATYRGGRYGRRIDYDRPCDPPLSKDDAAWASDLLVAAGRAEA